MPDGGHLLRGCFPRRVRFPEVGQKDEELTPTCDECSHLKLGNLIAVYDDNHISIDGSTEIAFTEDVAKRFESYDWQVLMCVGRLTKRGERKADALCAALMMETTDSRTSTRLSLRERPRRPSLPSSVSSESQPSPLLPLRQLTSHHVQDHHWLRIQGPGHSRRPRQPPQEGRHYRHQEAVRLRPRGLLRRPRRDQGDLRFDRRARSCRRGQVGGQLCRVRPEVPRRGGRHQASHQWQASRGVGEGAPYVQGYRRCGRYAQALREPPRQDQRGRS